MRTWEAWTWRVIFIASITFLLYFASQDHFPSIIGAYSLAFLAYYRLWQQGFSSKQGWILSIIIYSAAIFSFPLLSDDIYRFMWDGWLITEGVNPFSTLPKALDLALPPYQQMLLDKMNSPEYYSVYPPILQGLFAFVYSVVPGNIMGQSIVMKVVLFGFQVLLWIYGLRLLKDLGKDTKRIYLYVLNPLVIVELMGNLHMELIMISFFGISLFYLYRFLEGRGPKWKNGGAAVGLLVLSVASKLVTAITSVFLIRRLSTKSLITYGAIGLMIMFLLFAPMFYATYDNFGEGLDLYFQKFEFNASIYYIIREIGYWWKGYNIIASSGPWLAIISALGILLIAFKEKEKSITSLCRSLAFAFTIYYFLSTTVHPWYISTLVFLAIFSSLRYPYLWSYLALFSYAKYYGSGGWYFPMVGLEYVVLWIFMYWEWRNNQIEAQDRKSLTM